MRRAYQSQPKEQREAIEKMGKSKVGMDGMTMDCIFVRFVDKKGTQEVDTYKASDTQLEVLPIHLDSLTDKANVIRTNPETGAKEVCCKVTSDEGTKKYFAHHAEAALEGKYTGNFAPFLNYWDVDRKCLQSNVWVPLQDAMGNRPLLFLKVWRGDVTEQLAQGSVISVSVKFEQYLSIPKARGFAKAAENQQQAQAQAQAQAHAAIQQHVQAPGDVDHIPDEVLIAAATAAEEEHKPKRSPTIRFTMSTNSGFQLSENNTICSPLESFAGLVDDRRHFITMPEWDGDTYCMIVPLSGYQDRCDTYEDCEPGPSTI